GGLYDIVWCAQTEILISNIGDEYVRAKKPRHNLSYFGPKDRSNCLRPSSESDQKKVYLG
ncbi:MAG: hypothetical protein QOI77_3474, partial [Blastocatellia bacterium]|nr:hypothetical protein [Blastocatellia bacterium]